MWNRHRFHIIDSLPTGAKISGIYYTNNILQSLHQAFFPQGRDPHGKRLAVHVDNCSVHKSVTTESFMKIRDMVSMPDPPHSPDVAPNDFYLFPVVRAKLEHASITDEDQLFEELHTI
jgi:histone-lysine N-methyltransferase SETMAR